MNTTTTTTQQGPTTTVADILAPPENCIWIDDQDDETTDNGALTQIRRWKVARDEDGHPIAYGTLEAHPAILDHLQTLYGDDVYVCRRWPHYRIRHAQDDRGYFHAVQERWDHETHAWRYCGSTSGAQSLESLFQGYRYLNDGRSVVEWVPVPMTPGFICLI